MIEPDSKPTEVALPSLSKVISTTLVLAVGLLVLAQINAQTATNDHADYTHHVKPFDFRRAH